MAFIGMRYVVGAPITAESAGSEPTYGTGFLIGKAISANLNITRNTNPLYADDGIAEDDNGITGMDMDIGLDDLLEDVQENMGLLKKTATTGSPSVVTYYETSQAGTPMGVGYMRVRCKNSVVKYQAIWVYKIRFSKNSETASTKGENIEWQTPTVNGRCFGLNIDNSGDLTYRKIRIFDDESAAKTWLNTLAGYTPAA